MKYYLIKTPIKSAPEDAFLSLDYMFLLFNRYVYATRQDTWRRTRGLEFQLIISNDTEWILKEIIKGNIKGPIELTLMEKLLLGTIDGEYAYDLLEGKLILRRNI
jgi:hypothetical protein